MKIEVDDEMMEDLVVSALTESINMLEKEVETLKKKKNLKSYQKEDLVYNILNLAALKRTHYYFSGKNYWPKN